jgi:hypothetical protein
MAMTNTERQRRYRERAFRDPDGLNLSRVNVPVNPNAAAALKRLAHGYGVTQRALLERLLSEAEAVAIGNLEPAARGEYYDGRLPAGALARNETRRAGH